MPVDLIDFVPSLKREVNPPGTELFTGVDDATWVGYLSDAFWEARLDGFLIGFITEGDDADIQIVKADDPTGDIPPQDVALCVLYAGIKVLRNRILNMGAGLRAKAGPVEYEQQNSARVLVQALTTLSETKDRLIKALEAQESHTMVLDAFSVRVWNYWSYYGGYELT